jgi:hypothetical protein
VGLAAPQVGVNVRLMVFNETAQRGDPAETVLVNPEVRTTLCPGHCPVYLHVQTLVHLHQQHGMLECFWEPQAGRLFPQ